MYIDDIKTASPFRDLFPVRKRVLDDIMWDMRKNGYDNSQPLVLWKDHGNVIIDGHTRLSAAKKANIYQIPALFKAFSDEEAALKYAISCQRNRRNLSDSELVACVVELDKRRDKNTNLKQNCTEAPCGASGKSAKETAELLGINHRKVERIRTVMDNADDKIKEMVKTGRMTVNSAYNRTIGSTRRKDGKGALIGQGFKEFCAFLTRRFDRETLKAIMEFIARELEKTKPETNEKGVQV
ncbi:MAG: ParB N-terminal domain-containing protein [Victivallales bacterium]|jgi:ParB family chromosome partitioning protein